LSISFHANHIFVFHHKIAFFVDRGEANLFSSVGAITGGKSGQPNNYLQRTFQADSRANLRAANISRLHTNGECTLIQMGLPTGNQATKSFIFIFSTRPGSYFKVKVSGEVDSRTK